MLKEGGLAMPPRWHSSDLLACLVLHKMQAQYIFKPDTADNAIAVVENLLRSQRWIIENCTVVSALGAYVAPLPAEILRWTYGAALSKSRDRPHAPGAQIDGGGLPFGDVYYCPHRPKLLIFVAFHCFHGAIGKQSAECCPARGLWKRMAGR